MATVLDHVLSCLRAGVSVFPVRRDGSKAPESCYLPLVFDESRGKEVASWNPYREALMSEEEARRIWDRPEPPGYAIVGGGISGGMEVLDFDNDGERIYPEWCLLVEEQSPGLVERLPRVRTPRRPAGYHVFARYPDIDVPGHGKLAEDPSRPPKERTLIETRGEGGYVVGCGSPVECHETGRTWEHFAGPPPWEAPALSIEERDILLLCARYFDRPRMKDGKEAPHARNGELKPGTDFDRRGPDWADILTPHGWELAGQFGTERRWRRPGKGRGWSATTGHCHGREGEDLLRIFSSSTDFEVGAYGKFRAYAVLNHGGDLSAAAKDLAFKGYGGQHRAPTKPPGGSLNPPENRVSAVLSFRHKSPDCVSGLPGRAPEPYQSFPVEHLPRPVAHFVREGAEALGCDPAYLALPALAACAGAVGNSRVVRLKRTWIEPCVIWAAVVGDSGTLKTPAWKLALRPLWDAQDQHRKTYAYERAEHREEMAAHKKQVREQKPEVPPPEPEAPVMQRIITSDITIERLAELLEENPRGLLVARDELRGWIGSFTRYKAQGSDLSNWLELHSAGVLQVDRKTGEKRHLYVRPASVSVTGGIQPGILARSLSSEHFDAGLAARMLLANPARRPKVWTEADISEATETRYAGLIRGLLALQMASQNDSTLEPYRLGLLPDAKTEWVRFYDRWGKRQQDAEGDLAAAFSKLEGYAARLALLHHLCTMVDLESDDLRDLTPASVEAGVALSLWFAAETERIYAALTESEEARAARRLADWVRGRGGRCTVRDLKRSSPGRYQVEGAADAALESLVEAGWGRWTERQSTEVGGRPTRHFELLCRNAKTAETPDPEEGGEVWPEEGCAAKTSGDP